MTDSTPVYTTSTGDPVSSPYPAERVGTLGPLLLQDFHLIDLLAHFDHERIPERVVHAKGASARGYFRLTNGEVLKRYTSSKFFTEPGEYPARIRFSTVGGERGSADTARDPRGFAVKIKTPEGVLDWVFNNTPVFFVRDPAKFPLFIHILKRNPQTNLKDADMFWDYLTQNPESAHQVTILFTDRGTPDGFHNQHGYSGHTYKFVKESKIRVPETNYNFVYTKIHLIKQGEGFKTLDGPTAIRLSGTDPDYSTRMLYNAIKRGELPTWKVNVQIMTGEQAENFRYNILDITKVWPHREYPLHEIGELVLTHNVDNYFAEIEQIAFSPSNTIPYFEASADPVLQSRLFSYPDTQRHRLGVNYNQLPINNLYGKYGYRNGDGDGDGDKEVANFQRDGLMAFYNQGSRPNYPSSFEPLTYVVNKGAIYGTLRDPVREAKHERWVGSAYWDLLEVTKLDFEQPRALINKLKWSQLSARKWVKKLVQNSTQLILDETVNHKFCPASSDEKLAEELAEKLAEGPVEKYVEEFTKELVEKLAEEFSKELAEELAKELVKELVSQQPSKTIGQADGYYHLINNVVEHVLGVEDPSGVEDFNGVKRVGGVTRYDIKKRIVSYWKEIDEITGEYIADGIGLHGVKVDPLPNIKDRQAAVRFCVRQKCDGEPCGCEELSEIGLSKWYPKKLIK